MTLASKMAESMKFHAVQAFIYDGKEPIQFFAMFQSFVVFKVQNILHEVRLI